MYLCAGIPKGRKEGKALEVIEMQVRQDDVDGVQTLRCELMAQVAQAGAGIQDECESPIDSDLDA